MRIRFELPVVFLMASLCGCGGETPTAVPASRTVPLSSRGPERDGPPTEVIPASYTTSSIPFAPPTPAEAPPPAFSTWPQTSTGVLESGSAPKALDILPSSNLPLPPPPALPGRTVRADELPPPPPPPMPK